MTPAAWTTGRRFRGTAFPFPTLGGDVKEGAETRPTRDRSGANSAATAAQRRQQRHPAPRACPELLALLGLGLGSRLVAGGSLPLADLVTSVEPLERLPEVFARLDGRSDAVKVLIDCQA